MTDLTTPIILFFAGMDAILAGWVIELWGEK